MIVTAFFASRGKACRTLLGRYKENIFRMKIAAMNNPSPVPNPTGHYQPQGRVVGKGHCGS